MSGHGAGNAVQSGETKALADFAGSLQLADVPEHTRHQVKRLILDQLGCQIGSAELPWSQNVYRSTLAFGSTGPSQIMAMGDLVRPDDAAFVNGTFGAANEIDDAHTAVRTHAGAVVVPAVLAVAQASGQTAGTDVLLAAIVGYEVTLRVAGAGFPLLMAGHHHTSVSCGPFGSAAASARLLQLDADGMLNSLAIAGSHSGGIMEYTEGGGSVKRIYTGLGAQSGVRSAYLALHGVTGPASVLEGRRGFLEAFADRNHLDRLTDNLGSTYLTDGVGLKSFFAEYRIHAPLQALQKLTKQHSIAFGDIDRMTVGTTSITVEAVGTIIEPTDSLGAQFSMRFALAYAAKYGAAGLRSVPAEHLRDPEVLRLAHRIDVVIDPELEARKHETFGGVLTITTHAGESVSAPEAGPLGSPVNPMSDDQVADKFRALVEPVIPSMQAEAILAAVRELESADLAKDVLPHTVKH